MDTIIETHRDGIRIVQYNKPLKKNAIDSNMYQHVTNILTSAATDDSISVIVLTGTGDFYSSGNDFTSPLESDVNLETLNDILKEFINAFITFPKLLIAIVNGPAIGIAATTLALCDLVFASENSYFYTPFTKLGIVAEGCSTFTFPRIMGDRKAAEMLLCSHKMSAKEALDCGFVNYIYKADDIQSEVWNKIDEVSKLPQQSVLVTKRLLRNSVRTELLKTNVEEMKELNAIWATGQRIVIPSKI